MSKRKIKVLLAGLGPHARKTHIPFLMCNKHRLELVAAVELMGKGETEVVRAPVTQHATPGLRPEAVQLYGDLINELNDALVLVAAAPRRSPISTPGILTQEQDQTSESAHPREAELTVAPIPTSRYVAAECACQDGRGNRRALRMATGWWVLGPVVCGVCRTPFEPRRPEGRTSR